MKTIKLINQQLPRIGYGAMRLPGYGVMGPPKDRQMAIQVLKRTNQLGIKVIDTAWYYGPLVSDELIAEALYPYSDDLIIITKLGGSRDISGNWLAAVEPDELRAGMENDLKCLKIDSIPIVHLRWMDNTLSDRFKVAVETMLDMKKEGKLQHLGLSNVSQQQLDYVLKRSEVVTVSNSFSVDNQRDQAMIRRCEKEGIVYLPFFPLAVGKSSNNQIIRDWATKLAATPIQVALAWLLTYSPVILPIPGTSNIIHLEENFEALDLELPSQAMEQLTAQAEV